MNMIKLNPFPAIVVIVTIAFSSQLEADPVPLSALPSKLQEAVKAESSLGLVTGVERTVEDGETNYDVIFKKDEVERRLTFTSEGGVIWFQVSETDLPRAVRQIVNTEFKDIKPVGFFRVTEDEEPYYDLEIPAGNSTNSLSVAANGRWWSLDIEIADVPAPVRAFIESEFGPDGYDSICKTKEGGQIYYEAEGELNKHNVHLQIAPDGKLISREDEVKLEEVAPPARKTISEHFSENEIVSITRHAENNDVTFEVEASRDGKTIKMTVGRGGRIRPQSAN